MGLVYEAQHELGKTQRRMQAGQRPIELAGPLVRRDRLVVVAGTVADVAARTEYARVDRVELLRLGDDLLGAVMVAQVGPERGVAAQDVDAAWAQLVGLLERRAGGAHVELSRGEREAERREPFGEPDRELGRPPRGHDRLV